ncbi:DUF167 family protein [Nitratireductor sp. ZSWI3]|uniref:DUF167 family protein n=1 Tax=Nitratireductor sp. ZSWI3 TaxID=2966359 RepID=UPI0021504EC5|nr:DUF167 family protein [Nitratireductor sp. ZSWI3]MCR4265640.1 DUF167 family protein [Nitratireductor sp. ZSWI3]
MPGTPAWYRPTSDGVAVFVRLTPKSSRDAVEGLAETDDGRSHLKVRVRAVPENGKANAALEKLLAKQLRLPASAVSVAGGATSRLKTVEMKGEAADILKRLEALVAAKG